MMKRRGFISRVLAALGVGAAGGLGTQAQEVAPPTLTPPAPPCDLCDGDGNFEWFNLTTSGPLPGTAGYVGSKMGRCPRCSDGADPFRPPCSRCDGDGELLVFVETTYPRSPEVSPTVKILKTVPCPSCSGPRTWFVDSKYGNDSNSGLGPEEAFCTRRQADIMCEAGRHDVIYMVPRTCPTCNGTRYVRLNKTHALWLCPDCRTDWPSPFHRRVL